MPFHAACPSCGAEFNAPDHLEGESVTCGQCRAIFTALPTTRGPDRGTRTESDRHTRVVLIVSGALLFGLVLLVVGMVVFNFLVRDDPARRNDPPLFQEGPPGLFKGPVMKEPPPVFKRPEFPKDKM